MTLLEKPKGFNDLAARKNKINLSEDWKQRIKAGVLMDRLLKHVEGSLNMTPSQIKAADILLKKIVPDLARQELVGDENKPLVHKDVTDIKGKLLKALPQDELDKILAGDNDR